MGPFKGAARAEEDEVEEDVVVEEEDQAGNKDQTSTEEGANYALIRRARR